MATEVAILPIRPGVNPDDESSEAFQTRESLLATLSQQPGYQRSSWARETENPETLRLFIDWDNVDAHKHFNTSETYGPFKQKLATIFDHTKISISHIHAEPFPATEVFSSPTTEVLTLYFPEDYSEADRQESEASLRKLLSIIQEQATGCRGGSGGWAVEKLPIPGSDDKGTVMVALVGWDGLEKHQAFRESDVFKSNIQLLRGLKDLKNTTMVHVNLTDGPAPSK